MSYSIDIRSPDSVYLLVRSHNTAFDLISYLLEDGLILWSGIVHLSATASPSLISLFPHLPAILDATLEHLEVCMKILEAYLLMGLSDFMKQYAANVADVFMKVIGNVNDEGIKTVLLRRSHVTLGTTFALRPLETLLTLFPQEAPPVLDTVLQKLLSLILSDQETDVAVTEYLTIFARIALQNLNFFVSFRKHLSFSFI